VNLQLMDPRGFLIALSIVLLYQGAAVGPANARGIATTIEPSHGPVEITGCRASYALTVLRVTVDFKNNGTKTATAVRFYFRATDAFGQPLQSGTPDRLGTFVPGVEIQDSSGVATGLPANVASIVCRVEMVRFTDGTEWRGSYAPQGLYYPPTPSPTATPLR
jgi:hypothetical protein